MNIKRVLLFWIVIPVFIFGQDNDFSWLAGKWKMQNTQAEIYEEWKKDNIQMVGESYMLKAGQKKVTENLFLQNFAGQWAYIALPKGQSITLFALHPPENNTFIFENKEHDFPQRIIYKYDGKKTIDVTIDGQKNGQTKSMSFTFVKVQE